MQQQTSPVKIQSNNPALKNGDSPPSPSPASAAAAVVVPPPPPPPAAESDA